MRILGLLQTRNDVDDEAARRKPNQRDRDRSHRRACPEQHVEDRTQHDLFDEQAERDREDREERRHGGRSSSRWLLRNGVARESSKSVEVARGLWTQLAKECRTRIASTAGISAFVPIKTKRRRSRPEVDCDAASRKSPPSRYSPTRKPCSTIAEVGLNFRVRNGNGCGPHSMDGGKTLLLPDETEPAENRPAVRQPILSRLDPTRDASRARVVKPHGRLVLVSSGHCCPSTSSLSTSSSRTALQGTEVPGRSSLGVGFPLRCFQRLSHPHLATRQCRWRDNRYTIGVSIPVLSY